MGFELDQATLNVLQLGIGFFFIFFAFNTQGFVEEPVINSASDQGNINEHAGYYSLSIIYAVFTLSNFVAAPIVDILGPKFAMVIAVLCYTSFQVGFLFLSEAYLYISSAVLGFGAAILWTGQGSYLSQNCTPTTTSRNSSLLWGLLMASLLGGGIFLFLVFHQTNTTDNIPKSTVTILYSVFTVLSLIAAGVLLCLRAPQYPAQKTEKNNLKLLGSTFRLMFTKKMLLLAFVFGYTGIEMSFWSGIYPTCISFTKKLGSNTNSLLALNSICSGCGQMLAGLAFGILGDKTRKFGRDSIILMGTVIHLIVFALVYINFPADASLRKTDDMGGLIYPSVAIALIAGGLLGFGDACWNTQIFSLLCDSYPELSSQAFAIFKFYQSGLSCAAFFYSPVLPLPWHLAILTITSLIAATCFFLVERLGRQKSDRAQSYDFNTKEGSDEAQKTEKTGVDNVVTISNRHDLSEDALY